jgi:uncharacterized protein (TIGR02246 family)
MRLLVSSSLAGLLAAAVACASGGTSSTRAPVTLDQSVAKSEIAAVLAHGARAWNAGALDEFLSDYDPASTTTFVTPTGVRHGVSAIRAGYAARFAPGATRDSLHFENLEVDVLAPDVVNAIAYYVLMRGDSVTSRGPTSLVMRKTSGRWRIIHDHSS